MGVVIRPAAFTFIEGQRLPPAPSSQLAPPRSRPNRSEREFLAILVALAALTWIFALAGAAFAVRAMLVLCFATLAGRGRRVGVPAIVINRVNS
jgi:fatty acid desaturase